MNFGYWGKILDDGSWHHLFHHCLDVAAVADELLRSNPVWLAHMKTCSPMPFSHTRDLTLFLAACHDLGKFHPGFQRLSPLGEQLGHVRGTYAHHHTEYGLSIWYEMDPHVFLDLPDQYSLEPLLTAALFHHGSPGDGGNGNCDLGPSYSPSVTQDAREFVHLVADEFLEESYSAYQEVECEPYSWFLAGLIILADWIGSNEQWFKPEPTWTGFESYWSTARERAAAAVSEIGLRESAISEANSFAELLPHLRGLDPSLMQQAVLDLPVPVGPEMVIIEDLTGGGKTEAALLGAHRCMRAGFASGLYVGLPTMATANAMYGRLGEVYASFFSGAGVSLTLAHGSTFLNDAYVESLGREVEEDEDGGRTVCSRWLADNRKKALLAPCGAGTIDQAILGVLGAKHQSLRLLGLCRSVLVVDEVHSYDAYTGTLLANLLTFQAALGGSAILLSATMARELRVKLIEAWRLGRRLAGMPVEPHAGEESGDHDAFPLMTRVDDSVVREIPVGTTRSLNVPVRPVHEVSGMFDALCAVVADGACACWIRNTVADVLEAARIMTGERGVPEENVLVFHSRFTGGDRAEIERDVLRRFGKDGRQQDRVGKILIASQVVEQSLDLDFDVLLSDLAPMDLMIQRAGRCHRHLRPRPKGYESANMLVLMPRPEDDVSADWYADMFDKGQYVYLHPAVLWRTARLLRDKGCIQLPVDARELVEGAYVDGALNAPRALDGREREAIGKAMADEAVARFGMLDFSTGYSRGNEPWGADVTAPTRLGEDTHGLRLVRIEQEHATLWHDDGKGATMNNCVRSEVRVNAHKLQAADVPGACAESLAALIDTMPDKGKWCVCLPLVETDPGVWKGSGTNGRGDPVSIRYDRRMGLIVD